MKNNHHTTQIVYKGFSLGAVLAVTLSWSVNKSILWAILHGFFSWLYVLYFALQTGRI